MGLTDTYEAWSYELRMPLWGQGYFEGGKPCSASSADAIVVKLKRPVTPAPRSANVLRDFMAVDPTPF